MSRTRTKTTVNLLFGAAAPALVATALMATPVAAQDGFGGRTERADPQRGYGGPFESWQGYTTRELQQALEQAGYDPGPVDGRMGPGTRSAIRDFQRDHGLPVTGRTSPALWATLEQAGVTEDHVDYGDLPRNPRYDGRGQAAADIAGRRSPALVADVQYALRDLGFTVSVDGQMDAETRAAIRRFQRNQGLRVTGEPTGDLLTALEQAGAYEQDRTARADRTLAERRAGREWSADGRDRYEGGYDTRDEDRRRLNYGELVRRTEAELRDRGYRTGPVNMTLEPQSARAIQTYQQQRGMEPTGEPSRDLLADIRDSDVTAPPPSAADLAAGLIGGLIQRGAEAGDAQDGQ